MTSVDEDKAVNKMLSEAAILKMKKEQEAEKRVLTKEQRMVQRKQVCDYLMYQQEEAYFKQNHFIMDGKTKRRVRKMIERNYDKGRYGSTNGSSLNGWMKNEHLSVGIGGGWINWKWSQLPPLFL